MSWLDDIRRKYKADHPAEYAEAKKGGRWFGIGAVVAGIVIVSLVVTCSNARAASFTIDVPLCASWSWSGSTLTCVPATTVPPVTPPPVTPPPVVPPPSGGDFAGCPAGSITYKLPDKVQDFDTETGGDFSGNIVSVRFVAPAASSSNKQMSIVEFRGPQVERQFALSTRPCDFSVANAVKNAGGVAAVTSSLQPAFTYRAGSSTFSAMGLTPGAAYYVNARNVDCPGVCGARITIRR